VGQSWHVRFAASAGHVVFPNTKLDFAAVFLSVFQQLIQVVAQAGPKMPEPLRSLAPYASILTFDLSSMRSECSSLGSLHTYIELAASASLLSFFIPLAGVASLLRACHGTWKRRRNKASMLACMLATAGAEPFQDNQVEWEDPAIFADEASLLEEAPPSGLQGSNVEYKTGILDQYKIHDN
jgi:hypothetical protein